MRELVAQIGATGDYIPFLNLQYIYCFFASLFGTGCQSGVTPVEVPSVEGVGDGVVQVATTTVDVVTNTGGGFWSWLWPFGTGGAGDVPSEVATGGTGTATQDGGFFSDVAFSDTTLSALSAVGDVFSFIWTLFSWLSYSVSFILLLAIIAAFVGIVLIRMKEWSDLSTLPPRPSGKTFGWSRWQDLLDAAMTSEPKRWREAVIAADGMLGELLTRVGYHGQTTAEQMRSIPEGAFATFSQAWEAHRVKNFVAMKNSNYILTQREAFRVLKLYEQVFEEFDFI